MKKTIKIIGRVIATRYASTSYYGNPSYYVHFMGAHGEEIKGRTASNAACGYSIDNSNLKVKAEMTYHITKAGNIIIDHCRPVDPAEETV